MTSAVKVLSYCARAFMVVEMIESAVLLDYAALCQWDRYVETKERIFTKAYRTRNYVYTHWLELTATAAFTGHWW